MKHGLQLGYPLALLSGHTRIASSTCTQRPKFASKKFSEERHVYIQLHIPNFALNASHQVILNRPAYTMR